MLITMSILSTAWYILLFLIVLSVVICIHELGHFLFAKKAGILCHEFSFGMGPKLWSRKFGETVFSIRAIPFGGYVSMAGEEIEAEIIQVGKKIRLGFDSSQQVNRIIIDPNNVNYHDFLEITVTDFDLSSGPDERLYINEYTVKRNAMYVMDKKQIQIAPKDRSFTYKSKLQRFLTAVGGPLMNFVLAIVVYIVIAFMTGVPNVQSTEVGYVQQDMPAYNVIQPGDIIKSINGVDVTSWQGTEHSISAELSHLSTSYTIVVERNGQEVPLTPIEPQYIFYGLGFTSEVGTDKLIIGTPLYRNSELLPGDEIVSIDGKTFANWSAVITFAENYTAGSTKDHPTTIVVNRDGTEKTITYVAFSQKVVAALGYNIFYQRIGITSTDKFSFFGAFAVAGERFWSAGSTIFKTLGVLISSNQVHLSDLSGFVGIFTLTKDAAAQGFISLLSWVGLLSVNLGIVNLLPIPALDGGRIVFIGYELVTGKKPNQKFENALHTIMFFLLIGLLIYVTYYDILRLIGIR